MNDADRFLDLACLTYLGDDAPARREQAAAMLEAEPGLVTTSVHVAAAVGDTASLRALLDERPELATERGGPRGWAPLLSLCFSRVTPEHKGWDPLAAAHLLLKRGADPHSATTITDCRFSAVTGAIGCGESGIVKQPPHRQARALVKALLDAGADANDSQALYNTHFLPDNTWLHLFLDRGLHAERVVNWNDRSDESILEFVLGQAAQQGFTDRVQLLLEHGVPPDGRNHYNKRTHLENALLNGHRVIVQLLEERGADPAELSDEEQFQAACLAADEAEARRLLEAHPAARRRAEVLATAAEHGHLAAVRLALDLGLPIDARDRDGLTPLHRAARAGQPEVVRELIARGAAADVRDPVYGGTALNHAEHFLAGWPSPGRQQARDLLAGSARATLG